MIKYKLSKFIGRNEIPEDRVAFDRIAEAFATVEIDPDKPRLRIGRRWRDEQDNNTTE